MRKIIVAVAIFNLLIFTLLQGGAHALSISGAAVYTDNRGPNDFAPEGYYFVIVSPSITPSGLGTTVQATHIPLGSGPDYSLQQSPSPLYPNLYASIVPYSGQTGQWRISATYGLDTATMNTYILDDPKLLPLASNLAVSGPLLTPTLTWNLFDQTLYPSFLNPPIPIGSDFYMQRVRIRLAEADMPIVFDSSTFYTNVNSFTIPDGKLVENEDYLLDLMLMHFDLNSVLPWITQNENVSETFKLYSTTPVPEPTTMLLLGSGLIGLAGYGRKKFFKK